MTILDSRDFDSLNIAMDVGQTRTKVKMESSQLACSVGQVFAIQTHRPLLPQLRDMIRTVIQHLEAKEPRSADQGVSVALGVSGLTAPDADAGGLLALLDGSNMADLRVSAITLAHDSVTGYLGALGNNLGAVIAAGTGVVTLGVGQKSFARVDGWGHIMGDAGSAYWVGRKALQAAMRAHDGRGPATTLTQLILSRWRTPEDAYIELQSDADAVSVVASLSREVALHAQTDSMARHISHDAAAQLIQSVETSLRRVGEDGIRSTPKVAMIGGVFQSETIVTEFRRLLSKKCPRAELVTARGQGIDGAAKLPELDSRHVLSELVSMARR